MGKGLTFVYYLIVDGITHNLTKEVCVMATKKIGNTRGGRGRLGSNIRTMADYYNSGRASALNPGGTVRNQQGKVVGGSAKS